MNFRKTSEGGGGVISDPKNYVALFSVKEKRNGHRFPGKSATLFSENRLGQKPFGSFPKIQRIWSRYSSLSDLIS